ncbi:K02A2.6-like [Cordylochernes scorpioides]|uniref:K02A2.6-like n=1 Tax=Cordylochernes scorpioides TaxID=51811 RepID=A0ABY6LXB1_9ARAC|nr:K02A2.6-like [Cordylochernes scorpioides]
MNRPGKFGGGLAVLIKTLEIKFKEIAYNQNNGRQFVSGEFEQFTKMNGIRHIKTSLYNPSTNGLAERYVREFKNLLRKNNGKDDLETNLQSFLFAHRAFPQTVIKEFPGGTANEEKFKIKILEFNTKMGNPREVFHEARPVVSGDRKSYKSRETPNISGARPDVFDNRGIAFYFQTPSRVLIIPNCMLQLPLKRLRFNQISPFSSNNKKFRNDIVTERLSRQDKDIMELNQDPIGVKSDDPTETTEGRQEVRVTGRETTAPLADAVTQLAALLNRVKISDEAKATIPPFDGTYSAIQFFQAFDRKMEGASMGKQEKLLRLPNYLVRQPLELFRKLRMADRSYFQVRQTLLDLYPESSEASFAKYFAMKLTGQANLETYYREKTAMGLQLGLPQEVILETLTEGLPFNDQRLVRVVPPENLGEWFRLVQRIHGPSVPTTRLREDQPPTMSGPYHSTPRRPGMSKDIKQKVKTCPTCQLTKRPLGPTYGELSQPPEAKEPFDLLSLDTIAGFAKYGNTKIYLHVVVDHFSRYAWTFPSKSTSIITYQQLCRLPPRLHGRVDIESRQDSGRQGTSKQIDHCLYRKMEQGREEDSKEPMKTDTDYESGENTTFPKKENTLGRTEEIAPGQEDVTPPPPVSDVLGRLTTTRHQLSAVTGHRERWNRYNGSYEAQSFFTNYDAQADRAQLQYSTRLRKPPNLLQAPLRVTNTRAYVTCSPDHLQTTSPAKTMNSDCPKNPPTTTQDQDCPDIQDHTTVGSSFYNFY